jgi:hypothetical protein
VHVTTHRLLNGDWAECPEPEVCALKFHFPDMSVAEARSMPFHLLLPLLNLIDPPTTTDSQGQTWRGALPGILHREYDLPAVINEDGRMEWWVNNYRWREGDKPRVVRTPVQPRRSG